MKRAGQRPAADARHPPAAGGRGGAPDGIKLAQENDHWAANGGAIVALDPSDGAVLAMASSPTYKPSVYVGRGDPKKLAPLLNEEAAGDGELPRAEPRARRPLPAGIDVQAGHRARGDAGARVLAVRLDPVHADRLLRARPAEVRQLEPGVNQPMTLPNALAESCDTYFYEIGNRFYLGGDRGASRMQEWARLRVRAADRARHRRGGGGLAARRPSGARRRSRATGTGRGTPATRSSSRSARRICS